MSEEIVRNLQLKRVIFLFGELDSDQDGLISSGKVCIDTLASEVLEVLMPILFEMEEFSFELDIE
jgi:hypothetical protein